MFLRNLLLPRWKKYTLLYWTWRAQVLTWWVGANVVQYFFHPWLSFFFLVTELKGGYKKNIGVTAGKGYKHIKHWIKPIFPLFLTRFLHKFKFLITIADLPPPSLPKVICKVTRMIKGTCSSDKSAPIHQTPRGQIAKEHNLHGGNSKNYMELSRGILTCPASKENSALTWISLNFLVCSWALLTATNGLSLSKAESDFWRPWRPTIPLG
jgi:hypothetical protein